jgi:hypothetical protein
VLGLNLVVLAVDELFIIEHLIVFIVKELFQIRNVLDEILELSMKARDLLLVEEVFMLDFVVRVSKVVIFGSQCGLYFNEQDVFLVEIGN